MRRQKFLLPLPLSNLDCAKQLKLNQILQSISDNFSL